MSIVQTTQITFTNGYMEASMGGSYGDGVDVHLVVSGRVVGFSLTSDEADEFASHIRAAADNSVALRLAKDEEFDRVQAERATAGDSEEEADAAAADAAERVRIS